MTQAPGGAGGTGRVRPPVALAFATILFAALVIGGIGMVSLLLGEDPITAPGFGQFPGVFGTILAVLAFAGVLWAGLRRPHPSFWSGTWAGLAAFVVYLLAVWIAGAIQTADPVLAASVVGRLITAGFAFVVLVGGMLAGWGGIVLVHTRGGRPRWPWEDRNTP
ncbi:hypothetical protein [Microbacterium luticocti]|uniref:hypothetical protein n=1 Tax=Microbacterium luticocti TaxID=451764 RepID=UPI00048EDCBA|nr:hypothetical protein [Microbacterium luticocti]